MNASSWMWFAKTPKSSGSHTPDKHFLPHKVSWGSSLARRLVINSDHFHERLRDALCLGTITWKPLFFFFFKNIRHRRRKVCWEGLAFLQCLPLCLALKWSISPDVSEGFCRRATSRHFSRAKLAACIMWFVPAFGAAFINYSTPPSTPNKGTTAPPAVSFLSVHTKPLFFHAILWFYYFIYFDGFNMYSSENWKFIFDVFRAEYSGHL